MYIYQNWWPGGGLFFLPNDHICRMLTRSQCRRGRRSCSRPPSSSWWRQQTSAILQVQYKIQYKTVINSHRYIIPKDTYLLSIGTYRLACLVEKKLVRDKKDLSKQTEVSHLKPISSPGLFIITIGLSLHAMYY